MTKQEQETIIGGIKWAIFVAVLALTCASLLRASQPSIFIDSVGGAAPPNASGSPEGMSPVAALATCHTNGLASTTIEWPANGITLPAGNECNTANTNCGVLFLNTAAGRQYTEILSVAADSVVVEDSFNIALASAVDCAVGGRITNISPQLATDMKANHGSATHGSNSGGWQIFIVNAGASYTWTASRVFGSSVTGAGFYGVPDGSGIRPIVQCNFQPGICLNTNGADVVGLEFQNTNIVKTGTVGVQMGDFSVVRDSIIGGPATTSAFERGIDSATTNRILVMNNLIRNNVIGTNSNGSDRAFTVLANVFRGNTTGILTDGDSRDSLVASMNIFWENTTGIVLSNNDYSYYNAIFLNTFDGNTDAVEITDAGGIHSLFFTGNLITNNGVGVTYSGAARDIERESAMIDYNCYGLGGAANGSNVSGFILGPNVININPNYEDEATGDFTPTVTNFTIQTFPPGLGEFYPGTLTASEIGCGAIQPGESGGFSNVGI